jgi:hypothetical protein
MQSMRTYTLFIVAIASLAVLVTHNSLCTSCARSCAREHIFGKTWFSHRDQGAHEYLVMQMTADKRHQVGREEFYGDLAITLGWNQNCKRDKLASYFLNQNGIINVGKGLGNNTDVDIRASDIGLATDYEGTATVQPKYQNFIADFDLYIGCDEFAPGLWLEFRFPFVHTRWNAGLNYEDKKGGDTQYTAEKQNVDPSDPPKFDKHTYAITKTTPDPVNVQYKNLAEALLGDKTFGDAPSLTGGKIDNCVRTENGLGGIHLSIGYDFLRRERGNLGLAFNVEFPVANKPSKNTCGSDDYLFAPKIGSQNAWKVGGALRGQTILWTRDEHARLDVHLDARVHGLLRGETTRLAGVRAREHTLFNHYLLLKKYHVLNNDTIEYKGLERAGRLARVRTKTHAEGQATLMLQYSSNGAVCALGYNFFGRSKEKLTLCRWCSKVDAHYYRVIKGDAPILYVTNEVLDTQDGGFYSKHDTDIKTTGTWIEGNDVNIVDKLKHAALTDADYDIRTAAHPHYMSHTIFAHIGYNWKDIDWHPFVGILGNIEFGTKNTALTMWGIYLKGGISF